MTDEDRQYVLDAFRSWVRSGYSGDEILDEIEERIGDLVGPADPAFAAEVSEQVRKDLDAQRAREATWTEETVNDRIEEAFDELADSGIVALENAGYTISDGWSDCDEVAARRPGARGAVFWHGQDTERAVDGDGLLLAFGAYVDGDGHEAASLEIAREVCRVLNKNGVETEWDGTIGTRIQIPSFEWRKRRFTEAP